MKKFYVPVSLLCCALFLVIFAFGRMDPREKDFIADSAVTVKGQPVSEKLDPVHRQSPVPLEIPQFTASSDQVLHRQGYTTSYNSATRNPNWVAWHLTKAHTDGKYSRDGIPYRVDDEVKGARQELEDWEDTSLPVDHGHMCPAGDCKWSLKAMEETFLLTNMCPQNRNLNRGDWEKLERRCRGWACQYGDIYIVCGPIFYRSKYKTMGANEVGVPDAFYKVVLCMNRKPKALGFIYPNKGEHHEMNEYVTTVDQVEKTTGIDFFYQLPDSVETKVESESNLKYW